MRLSNDSPRHVSQLSQLSSAGRSPRTSKVNEHGLVLPQAYGSGIEDSDGLGVQGFQREGPVVNSGCQTSETVICKPQSTQIKAAGSSLPVYSSPWMGVLSQAPKARLDSEISGLH